MKHRTILALLIISISLMGCSRNINQNSSTQSTHEITDMAGRTVKLPNLINQVYSTGQSGVVMLYTLCPDKLMGWCLKLSRAEADYINAKYLSLPVLGLMQGSNNSANKEEIINRRPDIILLMTELSEDVIRTADEIQDTMGIPVVVTDYSLENICTTYEFLGDILNEAERAKKLSDYCCETLQSTREEALSIIKEDILTVYYAQGSTGLQTAPKGSSHSEVINFIGGNNVVDLPAKSDGRLNINMEQLLLYDPDVIVASYSMGHEVEGEGVFSIFVNGSEEWGLLQAVKNDMVFSTPCLPYNLLDMPPSVNRIIGIKWLGNLLYPQYFDYDIKQEMKEFYSLFYQKELSEDKLNNLLAHAQRKE